MTSTCPACSRVFTSDRGLQLHWNHNRNCFNSAVLKIQCSEAPISAKPIKTNNTTNHDEEINVDEECFYVNDTDSTDPIDEIPDDYDMSLIEMADNFRNSKIRDTLGDVNLYKAHVELMNMLKDNNAPLYMFDDVMKWAIRCNTDYKIIFEKKNVCNRDAFVEKLKLQFDLDKIDHFTTITELPGSKTETKIICHDFKMCLYSLLNDPNLMVEENLIFNQDNIFTLPKPQCNHTMDDIHTGTVYQKAYKKYIKDTNRELLCPIIFFIDKTHTDRNGRLCLEQIRFTLGIFNKETRNNAKAWQTLGYINDQNQIPTALSTDKVKDYQEMIRIILATFRETQKKAVGWTFAFNNQMQLAFLRCPILFIIGDTDGHDKLCGRYGSRMNVARLCRYCDCPFDETDNPTIKFAYTEQNKIKNLIRKQDVESLKKITMHCVKNAWHEVQWCDPKRGIHGGTCAEPMHCLQHGLFQYTLNQLYGQRKERKQKRAKPVHKNKKQKRIVMPVADLESDSDADSSEQDSDSEETETNEMFYQPEASENYSRNKVFSQAYCKRFDACARKYGKYLSRQSDRDLPRTHFFSNYTTVSCKNASEMTGILVVFLIMFSTKEGNVIDKELGGDRASAFMHVLELMLLLETFCKAQQNKRNEVTLLRQFMPRLLETLKTTLNRSEGNGMKIIKFHLLLHFADDILRFGVMSNFDSAMGESHHKSEAKKPAQRTQRRKSDFEEQTAKRQIEYTSIRFAHDYLMINKPEKLLKEKENKCYSIEYHQDKRALFFLDRKKKLHECKWKDESFQKQLIDECFLAVLSGNLVSPIRFFTQHNRQGMIFHASPNYKANEPWYDWVYVDWGESKVPAKMMLFLNVERCEFKRSFKFGHGTIEGAGSYAIGHTFAFQTVIQAHGISKLCDYGKLLTENHPILNLVPQLWCFDVDSIVGPCTAVPYNNELHPIIELEWIILKPKMDWYKIFVDLMRESLGMPLAHTNVV